MKNDYNIGLDIGNTSVGWAVTDCNNFKILKKGKKTLWGVRLFEAANTAEERRKYRSNRRKYDRRRQRIKLLQEEFKEEINKVDSTFFKKLEESFYNETDVKNKTIIINKEEKEKIKEYYKKYPTIYHLRSRLIHDKSQCDIRLVYLALHHIIKYRGNFLYNNSFNIENLDIEAKLDELIINLKNITNIDIVEENFNSIEIKEALSTISKVDKKINLNKCLPKIFSKKISQELIKLFLGDKFDVYKLFGIESDNDYKISLNGTDYEEKYDEINKILGDEIEILECLKNIYDMCFLINLFGNNKTENISDLMINIYNKHHEDLKTLKNIYKKDKKLYIKMFKENNCIYEQYLSNNLTYDNFIKQITKDLESINQNNFNDLENIKNRITNGEFLPLITSKNNGKYPYQLNKNELIKIIENQGVYYNFLLNKLDNNVYKLVKLLEFKIPYYVGPLNNTTKNSNIKNPNSWFIKKIENVKVTPYNFDEIIDKEKTAEKFIERMIGKCTYLINEPSMPANSILYSKYKVLNELKQIRVGEKGHEEKLRKELQDKIYKELFLTTNSITDKKFKDYLISTNEFSMIEDLSVLGYSDNNKFANNMSSYIDFFGPNGYLINTKYNINDAENIIRLMTIFEDKNILKEKLEKEYPLINQKNIENICRKKYKGWGNLSKKLLTEVYYFDKKEEKSKSILTLMEETSENFMQILNNKEYNYDQKIKEINNKKGTKEKFNYDIVSDLVTSPSTKRGIYQALKVIEEIIEYMGYVPKKIVLEMARGEGKKERKVERKKYIENIYEKNKNQIENYNKLKKELANIEKINCEKLFLYFFQEGKSLYSQKPLDINRLFEYEVDHIIPQTLIKDNSIENKALVLKEENQIKAANTVLPAEFRKDYMKSWWQHLKKLNLITDKKYNNLCRYKFDNKSIEGFINRQLVETRQITKHVTNIINNLMTCVRIHSH